MKTKLLLAASFALLASCNEKTTDEAAASTATATATAAGPSAALAAVLAAAPSGEPAAIATIRATAKPGDEITIGGRIMGTMRPFVDGRAAFILGDPGVLTPCNEKPGDECDTPWDTCCDSPEDKKRGTATIQIVDAGGRVLAEPAEGVGGLENLARVTVTGTVAEGSSPDLLVVNASAIRVGGNE